MTGSKATYKKFCEQMESKLPLFFQPYWLDAVSGPSGWDCVLSKEGSVVSGVMPFARGKNYGMTVINNPPLTPHTGIYFVYPDNLEKEERKLAFENRVTENIIANIPKNLYFSVCFNPVYSNWLAFYWKGYKQSTKYTYIIPSTRTEAKTYEAINSKAKNKIKKAAGLLTIEKASDIQNLHLLNEKTFARQGVKNPIGIDKLNATDDALASRNQRKIYLARDKNGELHAGLYVVNDMTTSYCIITGSDPSFRSSGAISFLLWTAIKETLAEGRSFDFEGSMMSNVEPFFRNFGAQQTPYYRIYGSKNKWTHALFALLGKW